MSAPSEPPPPILVTIREAAEMLGVGRTTTYELISCGELKIVHIGRCARVPVQSVIDFVDALRCSDAT